MTREEILDNTAKEAGYVDAVDMICINGSIDPIYDAMSEFAQQEVAAATHPLQEKVDAMTDDERMELFGKYCKYCGRKDPNCQCWNDD